MLRNGKRERLTGRFGPDVFAETAHDFVRRHRAQGPHQEHKIPGSRWRHSLMNWGHDPLKD